MKHVFSDNSKIAHLWANKLQSDARNSSRNFYFNNDTIYSYGSHFPIAKHVANDAGQSAILVTERSYSVSTSKHVTIVKQAIVDYNKVIYCDNPNSSHIENFVRWISQGEDIVTMLSKAKKPVIYLSKLSLLTDRVNKYANFFSVVIPESLQALLNISNKEQYSSYLNDRKKYIEAENKRVAKEQKAKHRKELKQWYEGNTHRLYLRDGYDYLRLNEGRIETTQAVRIPLEIAKRVWEAISNNTLTIGTKVLDYVVLQISKDNIKIGCHNFKTDYLIEFGRKHFNN